MTLKHICIQLVFSAVIYLQNHEKSNDSVYLAYVFLMFILNKRDKLQDENLGSGSCFDV